MTQSKETDNCLPGTLLQDLVEENEFLLKLVDTIPANFYFTNEIRDKITNEKHKKMDLKAEALKRTFSDHDETSAKGKHKRARLDPECQKSVSQIQEELNKIDKKKSKRKRKLLSGSPSASASLKRAANIEELHIRLQERLSGFKSQRKATTTGIPQKKRLSKAEKKLKKKKPKIKQNNEKEERTKKPEKKETPSTEAKPPTYNKDGKIIFSKLDFSENGIEKPDKKKNQFAGKDYKNLLKKAEKKKEKLEKLKASDPEMAMSVEEKEKWDRAILRSENVKVKDDPALLKKSIKKQEKIKKKKAKEWKERIDHEEHKKKAKQEKRTKNIQKKKKERLDKKIKRAKKKGRVILS